MIVENKRKNANNDKNARDAQKEQDFVVTARYLSDDESQSEFAQANLNYNDFFGLEEAPFSISPNPRFLYMSEHHQEALAHLLYGVSASNGFILLTGEVGTGKTTVIRAFLQQLPTDARVAYIVHAKMSATELLETIAEELNIELGGHHSVRNMVTAIHKKLLEHYATGYRTYLLIDEAQNLTPEVLEEIRLLTNLETDAGKLLHIILVGQTELRDMFQSYELRQLNQRITARYHLHQLSLEDVTLYVQHRLAVAKSQRNPFMPKAMKAVAQYSKGIPRLINVICDRALLAAFSRHKFEIDQGLVKEAAKEVLGRIAVMPWEKTEKTEVIKRDKRLGTGTKIMLGMITLCMIGLAGGPYASNWWTHYTAAKLRADLGTAAQIDETVQDIAPVETDPQAVVAAPVTDTSGQGSVSAQSTVIAEQDNTDAMQGNSVAARQTYASDPQYSANTSSADGVVLPADDGKEKEAGSGSVNQSKDSVAASAPPDALTSEEILPEANVSKAGISDETVKLLNKPAVDIEKAEPEASSSSPVADEPLDDTADSSAASQADSGKTLDRVMNFEQGLLALRQMNSKSVNAEEAAEILSTGCNALENTGCLQLERGFRQMVRMETPFLFKLAPAQLRSIGVNFTPPSSAGLTRHTWFIVTGYNSDTDQVKVQSQDWTGILSVDDIEEAYVEKGVFVMKTPIRSLPKGELLGEDHAQWIIQHIGFADGSRLDPVFDIIVSKETLATAVRAFQKRRGLGQDGLFGVRTLVELNREVDPGFPQLETITK